MHIAVIGAGWAGLAAAIAQVQAGHRVSVFEAARAVGGRARAIAGALADGRSVTLDNGQHVLIGAYRESLRLMRLVGVDTDTALLRLPLTLRFADGQGLQLPALPPPLDALLGIARARGWRARDKLALLRQAAAWRLRGFRCAPQTTVAQLCAALGPLPMTQFIEPLCVSALNTPAQQASGQVFLRVLQDGLFSGPGGSNLLLPRTDLSALFAHTAARWLERQGARVLTAQRVLRLSPSDDGRWQLACAEGTAPTPFDHIHLACPAWEASRLVAGLAEGAGAAGWDSASRQAAQRWSATAQALRFTAIATVYAQARGARLPRPMLALRSTAERPAQFVFDRGQLGGDAGLLAFVVSASDGERERIERQVLQQAREQLALPPLQALRTVLEKRATFACTPGLQRPAMQVLPQLTACGDYVQGPYPATLEGAALSGAAAAAAALALVPTSSD